MPDEPSEVVVVRTGLANIASIGAALERAGLRPRLSDDAPEVLDARLVVLPGVGAFGPAMAGLRRSRLDEAIVARAALGRPLLAICLGLQVLCVESDESPGVAGLGVIPGRVTRLRPEAGVRVPHLGWNRVSPGPGFALAEMGMAYFANSFKLDEVPAGWSGCVCVHGRPFVAALRRGPLLACQFHPELSGDWGAVLMARWAKSAMREGSMACLRSA
jgi:imidazole glycerol-phosphate synthase subunit HisH